MTIFDDARERLILLACSWATIGDRNDTDARNCTSRTSASDIGRRADIMTNDRQWELAGSMFGEHVAMKCGGKNDVPYKNGGKTDDRRPMKEELCNQCN